MTRTDNLELETRPRREQAFSAPARVNLIGEHTDYTGGLVMPIAIPFETTATFSIPIEATYSFSSDMFATTRSMSPQDRSAMVGDWSDYPVGVLRQLQNLAIKPPPFALRFTGTVPVGSGLSSSASIEVATAIALLAHSGRQLHGEELAKLCRRAENEYVQSPCGIMDQFAVANCRTGHALMLNTRDLTYELLPMNTGRLAQCVVVIANSGVCHSVATGNYGVRRCELEAGQSVLCAAYPQLRDLGDATLDRLESCRHTMSAESFRRCRHIITENSRVRQAAASMHAGDPQKLGNIMTRAHVSERDDFECSIPEIDFLVDTAVGLTGCYGARLTGGGFGGCTVNLVERAHAVAFGAQLQAAYLDRYNRSSEIYICEAVDGAVVRNASISLTAEKISC